ncbi:unnamed protein product [Musa banksii]
MGLGGAAKDTKEREEVVHIACSICLEAVKSGGDRSTARLQCGHEFHLDCIGSAFNAKGVMQCPNCRKVEEGNWLYANGSHPTPELNMDDYIHDEDLYSLGYMENPFGGHWCPFRGLARIPSLFEEGESSPPVAFRDPLGYHAIVMENQATLSAAHPCPFIGARLPQTSSSSSNHPFDVHTDGPGYHYRWSHFPSARDVQNPLMMAPSNLHYRGWQHHHPSYSPNAHVGGADAASGFPRLRTDGLPTADSVFHLFVLSHGSGSRAGATSSSVPSLVPPYLRNHGNIHERYRLQTSQRDPRNVEGTDPTLVSLDKGDAGSGSRRGSHLREDGQGVIEGLKCELCFKMCHKSKIKLAALVGITLSVLSLFVHLFVANYSVGDFIQYKLREDYLYPVGHKLRHRRLWGPVSSLEVLQPYAKPRSFYPVPGQQNGFIYAKISGGFEKIRSSICDLVAIARLLNATLVIPEIQQSVRSKGISPKFRSFSYLYDEEQFIASLSDDVIVVKSLPKDLKEARKKTKFPTVSPKASTSPSFYTREVLPKLKQSKVIRILVSDGGCLQPILPSNMDEYQRLRCRVAFHALQFRSDIRALGNQMVERLRGTGGPYLSYHPGFVRDTLAFHGCAELFQDVHTELMQYTRKQLIKQGTVDEDLVVDSFARKTNGSCPLIPEEVGLLLRAMGYPPNTIIYLAGSETFGGQRILVPLRAMYTNLVDRTSLCTKKELSNLIGPEYPLPLNLPQPPPVKSEKQLIEEWKKAGPRPRPLPPPPARPFYQHEKEGWYGWIAETDTEPDPSSVDLRKQAHRLLWDALDYYVSVEADAFFPGFNNDGSAWPDFSSLVMGHRSYQTASGVTYRPNRKTLVGLLISIHDNLYHPTHNWTVLVRDHLNKSLGVDGFIAEAESSKPASFLSHPFPECSCRTSKSSGTPGHVMSRSGKLLYGNEEECPEWMVHGLAMASQKATGAKDEDVEEGELLEDDNETDGQSDPDNGNRSDTNRSMEQDEEMDPDD